jgi:DinB superfamily
MRPVTPYSKYLGDRDPIAAMREAAERIGALTADWSEEDFARASAPGKWTARQLLAHLVHVEIASANRARMALTTPGYVVQPFDQDRWMEREVTVSGRHAADAFLALSRMNVALFSSLTPVELGTRLSHPEQGEITVDWILHTLAGHQRSHLRQIEEIAAK